MCESGEDGVLGWVEVSSCARYIVCVQVSLQVTEFGDWLQIIVCSMVGSSLFN